MKIKPSRTAGRIAAIRFFLGMSVCLIFANQLCGRRNLNDFRGTITTLWKAKIFNNYKTSSIFTPKSSIFTKIKKLYTKIINIYKNSSIFTQKSSIFIQKSSIFTQNAKGWPHNV